MNSDWGSRYERKKKRTFQFHIVNQKNGVRKIFRTVSASAFFFVVVDCAKRGLQKQQPI